MIDHSTDRAGTALERHYRTRELAELWGFCDQTMINLFDREPGVLKLAAEKGKRKYITLSIPASVAIRVHDRLSQQPLQSSRPSGRHFA